MPAGVIGTLIEVSADPAAGGEIVFVADQDLIVHSGYFTLVTSATVNNRRVHLVADDGNTANIFFRQASNTDQAAGATQPYSLCEGFATNSNGTIFGIAIPATGLRLRKNDRFRTLTTLLDAGDNYSSIFLYVEHY